MKDRTTFTSIAALFSSADSIHRNIASVAVAHASITAHIRITLLLGLVVLLLVVAG